MLPAAHRMRRREDFALAVRRGRRAGTVHLVAHLLPSAVSPPSQDLRGVEMNSQDTLPTPTAVRVGFVVSKAVGPAVVRGRVKRRLRAVLAARVDALPAGSLLVVRALPASALATSAELAGSVDQALARLGVAAVTG
ncbi:ribonuclease P protein component [Angustibacter sp. McL0619]|uniref:ribonuclease P protein component n=1 Tax=Angustibacter sp. McL0619 TaxID=3415676 RepID=UPI003CEB9356